MEAIVDLDALQYVHDKLRKILDKQVDLQCSLSRMHLHDEAMFLEGTIDESSAVLFRLVDMIAFSRRP